MTADLIIHTRKPEPAMRDPALLLQNWLSPAFPVGGFAYSHGLEFAIHAGLVTDRKTCCAWIGELLTNGSWRNDAIIASAAWRSAQAGDGDALAAIRELALALSPSRERHLETVQQGNAFLAAIGNAWPHPALANNIAPFAGDMPYPVALGLCASMHGVPRSALIAAFGMAFSQALVSAALRLSIIGHTDGQRVLAELLPVVTAMTAELEEATLDDIGGATLLSDLCSMQHETQYTRFFRS